MRARSLALLVFLFSLMFTVTARSHPMPNGAIEIGLADAGARFDIAVPLPELRLALPRELAREADLLAEPQRAALLRYFDAHFTVCSSDGRPWRHQLISITACGATILLTAVHAIRPLWAGREWLIATSFGIVHGLAFSEALVRLALGPWQRAQTILGFNLGVEGAQLAAMVLALPLLLASRQQWFHVFRIATMCATVLLAGVWMVERA
jgi:hypothetical protein